MNTLRRSKIISFFERAMEELTGYVKTSTAWKVISVVLTIVLLVISSLFGKTDENDRRLNKVETNQASLQATLSALEKNTDRANDKLDKLLAK